MCNHIKIELDALHGELRHMRRANAQLKQDYDLEITNRDSTIAAKDAENELLKKHVSSLTKQFELKRVNVEYLQREVMLRNRG